MQSSEIEESKQRLLLGMPLKDPAISDQEDSDINVTSGK